MTNFYDLYEQANEEVFRLEEQMEVLEKENKKLKEILFASIPLLGAINVGIKGRALTGTVERFIELSGRYIGCIKIQKVYDEARQVLGLNK